MVCDVAVAHAQNLVNPSEHIGPDFFIPITAKNPITANPITAKKKVNIDIRVEQLMYDLKDLLKSAAETKKILQSDDSVSVDVDETEVIAHVTSRARYLLTECKDVAKKEKKV